MTFAEEQAFAQARAHIERIVDEVGVLARNTGLAANEFFQTFLSLSLDAVDGMGGAVWVTPAAGEAKRIAELSFVSSGYGQTTQKQWIDRALGCTVSSGKPCIVAVQEGAPESTDAVGNAVPHPFFYIPIIMGSEVPAVVQVWLKHAGDPRSYTDISSFLAGLAQQACLYLHSVERINLIKDEVRYRQMSVFQETILGDLDSNQVAATAANYLVDLLPCALGATLRRRGVRWRLVSASNQETVDPSADQSQALSRLAAILPQSSEARSLMLQGDASDDKVKLALAETGYRGIAWCHVPTSKRGSLGAMLLGLWHEPPSDPSAACGALNWIAAQLARSLDAATHFENIPLRGMFSAVGRILRAWREDRRRRVLSWVIAPFALLLGVLLFPAPHKIKADCAVVPARTAIVVAETDGKLVAVPVAEGDQVAAGQLLGRLEDTDFAAQLAASAQQLSRYRVEAARAQALVNEPDRKIAELSARREEENIKRLEYLRARTELRSPIDGVVLTRGVQHRAGEAMEKGKIFCEVGSLGAYDLEIDLRQQDLGPVLEALAAGEALPVDFILHAHSQAALRGELSGALQVSQVPQARAHETVFVARLPFPESSLQGGPKAGYTGKASIRLGQRPLGWLLLKPFVQYWRVNWGL